MGKTKTAVMDDTKKKEKVHLAGLKGGQRVKMVGDEVAEKTEPQGDKVAEKTAAKHTERGRSKKYQDVKKNITPGKTYPIKDAIKLVKETSYSKFDGTMEMHIVVKKVGISSSVTFPFQAGKEKKVEIATDETIKKLSEGKIDFDRLIATPEMMPKLVPFARLLGPKGLMPNPKNGTLVTKISEKSASGSSQSTFIKTEKEAPLIHLVVGKNSQKDEEIAANVEAIVKALDGGKQIARAFLKSTMSPSVHLQLN